MADLGVRGEPDDSLGSPEARAWGINNAGRVVGEARVPDPVLFTAWDRAVLWDDGNSYDLDDLVAGLPEGFAWMPDVPSTTKARSSFATATRCAGTRRQLMNAGPLC